MPLPVSVGSGATVSTEQVSGFGEVQHFKQLDARSGGTIGQTIGASGALLARYSEWRMPMPGRATTITLGASAIVGSLGALGSGADYCLVMVENPVSIRWDDSGATALSGTIGQLLIGLGSVPERMEMFGPSQIAAFRWATNAGETVASRVRFNFYRAGF